MTNDGWKAIVIYLVVMAVCSSAVVVLALTGDRYTCGKKAEAQKLEHQWGPFKGCLIKVDGKWIDYDKWRVIGVNEF
jgi:hypothetical protein